MAKKEITYNSALAEVELLLTKIEDENIDIEDLTSSVKRIGYLIKLCKDKLNNAESELNNVIKEIE